MIIITYLSVYCKYLYYFNMDPMAIHFPSSENAFGLVYLKAGMD